MHRLFVALRPPVVIRSALLDIMGGIAGARWQSDDQLHITLRFIGEVGTPLAEDIAGTLAQVRGTLPALALFGVGQLDTRGQSRALWAGITPREPLIRLHRKINAALRCIGLTPEGRAFMPHVTLARLNLPVAAVEPFLTSNGALASPDVPVDHFLLYESRIARDGARYDAIARYPLIA